MEIFCTNKLNQSINEQVSNLLDICKQYENINGCIFLEDDINYIQDFPCYIYCTISDVLVGFLSIFIPDDTSCEIYAYVHPNYRNRHIFTSMYDKALNLLKATTISDIQIVCEPNSTGEQMLLAKECSNPICECMMKFNHSYCPETHTDFSLIPYNNNTYIELTYNNIILGHCRIDYTKNCATIYDVEIYEENRGKGYSKILINLVLNHIKKSSIVLHVTASNTNALRAYTSCGFEIIDELHFYKISL
ncbi:MAG: GNAT family N-acetyltransferase [Lachnospiraceae bacterium]|nr:GNAT family N-acetyltransferase [Lachnospiraceae bacterium]